MSQAALVAAGGVVMIVLSLQALLAPVSAAAPPIDAERTPAAAIALPGWESKVVILALGAALIAVNWRVGSSRGFTDGMPLTLVPRHPVAILTAPV